LRKIRLRSVNHNGKTSKERLRRPASARQVSVEISI
jgi:hypothetical protein